MIEAVRLVCRTRHDRHDRGHSAYVAKSPPEAVEPVLLVPGFMAGDASLAAMHAFLRRHGLRTYRSGIRVNAGCTQENGTRLERRVEEIVLRRDRPVSIVGHSLGGMLARGLAARRPDLVGRLVTLGSPVLAPGAVHPLLAWDTRMLVRLSRAGLGGLMKQDCVAGGCAARSFEELRAPLSPSIDYTAIYSPRDGIVDPRACAEPAARPVEVPTSHCGMAIDPVCFDAVLAALRSESLGRSPDEPLSRASRGRAQRGTAG